MIPNRSLLVCALGTLFWSNAIAGQVHRTRSVEYLSVASVSDVRANWVNPAGLKAVPEASVMLEFTTGRNPMDEFQLDQFALGFNSRGISVVYLRNRFPGLAESTTMLRLATGLPFSRGALGVAVTLYGAPGENDRGVDIGLQYALTPMITAGAVARNLGRPEVGPVTLPNVFAGGALLSLGGGTVKISADAQATEILGAPSREFSMTYLGAASLTLPMQRPVHLMGGANLGSNLRIDRLHVGLAFGGRSHVGALVTGVSRNANPTVDRVSVFGVSSNLLVQR